MIAGPVLGGCYPAAYYPVVLAGGGGTSAVSAVATYTPILTQDVMGVHAKVQVGAPRYPGSRQRFEDGIWIPDDAALEEIGGPLREAPPETAGTVDSLIATPPVAESPPAGLRGLGIHLPPVPPVIEEIPQEPPLGEWAKRAKREREIARFNAEVLAQILPHLLEF